MKNFIKINCIVFLAVCMAACKKDFLNQEPLDALSTGNSLATVNELRMYMNQFYSGNAFPVQPTGAAGAGGIANNDLGTDNMIFNSLPTRLAGKYTIANAGAITTYNSIRSVNYFFENYKHAKGDPTAINQYLGEAKFFRALYYFGMVKSYGDVTWINKVMPTDVEAVKMPRDSRMLIVDSILSDLDQAIILLPAQVNSASMRLHKDVALAFKSRVALYEATWQKYHKAKNDPFFTPGITDAKITSYFTQARDAAQTIISSGRWRIYNTGKPLTDYNTLFVTTDLSTNPEILLWKKYNLADNIGNNISKYICTGGGGMGYTSSFVDDYLTIGGAPFTGDARATAQLTYAAELQPTVRDPRLSQTVAIPGAKMKPTTTYPAYPSLNKTATDQSFTGYAMYKFLETNLADYTSDGKSTAPAISFRYAEVLLNCAEAMVELGDEASVPALLKPLRDRAGMPGVDFAREFNSDPSYPFNNLSPALQSVRRERRVELAAEGFRADDIMRWAAADVLLVGKRPLGTLFTGSDLPGKYTDVYYDAAPAGKSINLYLSGAPGDQRRYIDPYKNLLPNGYEFNVKRDYLLPIQQRMLQLTDNKWTQNPGF